MLKYDTTNNNLNEEYTKRIIGNYLEGKLGGQAMSLPVNTRVPGHSDFQIAILTDKIAYTLEIESKCILGPSITTDSQLCFSKNQIRGEKLMVIAFKGKDFFDRVDIISINLDEAITKGIIKQKEDYFVYRFNNTKYNEYIKNNKFVITKNQNIIDDCSFQLLKSFNQKESVTLAADELYEITSYELLSLNAVKVYHLTENDIIN